MRTDGSWLVTTWTGSMYLLDLDNGTVTRAPDLDNEVHSSLRQDSDTLRLLGLLKEPVVGGSLQMLLEPLSEEADVTVRLTSEIIEIKELTSSE